MNEYIKKEDAIEALQSCHESKVCSLISQNEALVNIEVLPSADVVEIVRCKDCKHHEELLNNNDGNVLCWVHDIDVVVDGNGYCNYGERKEQEHETDRP